MLDKEEIKVLNLLDKIRDYTHLDPLDIKPISKFVDAWQSCLLPSDETVRILTTFYKKIKE